MKKTVRTCIPVHFPKGMLRSDAILDIAASTRFYRTSALQRVDLILRENDTFYELTLMSEKESDEYEMLTCLSRAAEGASRIITFNGHSFDLPHLRGKYRAYRLEDPFEGKEDFDLIRELWGLASFFGLPSNQLRDYAAFLGLPAGAEKDLSDPGAKPSFCDAEIALELMSLFSFLSFLRGEDVVIRSVSAVDGLLVFDLKSGGPFPRQVSVHDACFHVLFREDGTVRLSSRIESGTVRFYHTDLKNYEYLPAEGYAIHRSASAFVDKSRKEKAGRETCFHRFLLSDAFFEDKAMQEAYLRSVLQFLLSPRSAGSQKRS